MEEKKGLSWGQIHRLQIREILKHEWIMSEKHGRDLGEEAVKDWICKHAADFRKHWGTEKPKESEDERDYENSQNEESKDA